MNTYSTISDIEQAILQVGDTVRILGERTEGDIATMTGRVRAEETTINNRVVYSKNGLPIEVFPVPATEATKEFVEGEIHDFHTDTIKDVWKPNTRITSWVHKIFQEGNYYIPKTIPFVTATTWHEDQSNWVIIESAQSIIRQIMGSNPIKLESGLQLVPDTKGSYPLYTAFGLTYELPKGNAEYTVASFNKNSDNSCNVTTLTQGDITLNLFEPSSKIDSSYNKSEEATRVNPLFKTNSITLQEYTDNMGVSPDDFTHWDTEVSADWCKLMTATVIANTLQIPLVLNRRYEIEKTWYVNCDDYAKAKASVNGENIYHVDKVEYNVYTTVKTIGYSNTIISYSGNNHAMQLGVMGGVNYEESRSATWYTSIEPLKVTTKAGTMAKYGIAASWIHFMNLKQIHINGHFTEIDLNILGGIKSSNISVPSLWCVFDNINIRNNASKKNLFMHGNSMRFVNSCFISYASEYNIDYIGHRNEFSINCESTSANGKTKAFIRCNGSAKFFSPDLESGPNGMSKGFEITSGDVDISNPTIIGITGTMYDETGRTDRGSLVVFPKMTTGRQDNAALNRLGFISNRPIHGNFAPIGKLAKSNTVVIDSIANQWIEKNIMTAGTPVDSSKEGDLYGSGLLFHGVKVKNTSNSTVYDIKLRGYATDNSYVEVHIGTMDKGTTVLKVDKDFGFAIAEFDKPIYKFAIRFRHAYSASGLLEATGYSISLNNFYRN